MRVGSDMTRAYPMGGGRCRRAGEGGGRVRTSALRPLADYSTASTPLTTSVPPPDFVTTHVSV